jgi:hypothetical protein
LVITPAFPPSLNGVQDFADILASALSIETPVEFIIISLSETSEKSMLALMNSYSFIHLHYVGYGYSPRGIPSNLVQALEKWKQNIKNQLLVTFHELFARSNFPWKSSFYLQKYQRFLFLRLLKITDYAVSSCQAYVPYFTSPVIKLPVFSNMPAPSFFLPFEMRHDHAVIWGNLEAKRNTYFLLKKYYHHISKYWKWSKVLDIGVMDPSPTFFPIPILQLGVLCPNEISSILSSCKYAVLTTHLPDYFAKSGVFAAYASHGLAVLSAPSKKDFFAPLDGLLADFHFQKMNASCYQPPSFLASNVKKWYAGHDVNAHVNLIYLPIINHFSKNDLRY